MDKTCGKINITAYGFLRLLAATIRLKRLNPLIDNHKLEQNLYDFYDREEYHFLFEDICRMTDSNGDNNYANLKWAFQRAYTFGLLL